MTATKTLTEREILQLAASELYRKLNEYLDKAERSAASSYCQYDIQIEAINEEINEIEERIKALEGKDNE